MIACTFFCGSAQGCRQERINVRKQTAKDARNRVVTLEGKIGEYAFAQVIVLC